MAERTSHCSIITHSSSFINRNHSNRVGDVAVAHREIAGIVRRGRDLVDLSSRRPAMLPPQRRSDVNDSPFVVARAGHHRRSRRSGKTGKRRGVK